MQYQKTFSLMLISVVAAPANKTVISSVYCCARRSRWLVGSATKQKPVPNRIFLFCFVCSAHCLQSLHVCVFGRYPPVCTAIHISLFSMPLTQQDRTSRNSRSKKKKNIAIRFVYKERSFRWNLHNNSFVMLRRVNLFVFGFVYSGVAPIS